jgi:hypothetical protein
MHRWFIFSTWGMLAVVGALLVLLYNLYPDRSLDAWVDRSAGRACSAALECMGAAAVGGRLLLKPPTSLNG